MMKTPVNVYKKYEVQVVLNPGAGAEIVSDAEELMVAEMSIVNVVGDEIEELRYSDGSWLNSGDISINAANGRCYGGIKMVRIRGIGL